MKHEAALKAVHGLGTIVWSVGVSSPVSSAMHPDYRLAAIYGGFGCIAALLLPLWSLRYRNTRSALACVFTGAIVGALVGPAGYDYWGQSGMAVLTVAVCALIAPAVIANPPVAYDWLLKIIRLFRK